MDDYTGGWHLNEAVNTTTDGYKESTANGYHMTGNNMTNTAVTGALSEGLGQDFDGVNDDMATSSTVNFGGATEVTFSGWFYREANWVPSHFHYMNILGGGSVYSGSNHYGFQIYERPQDASVRLEAYNGGSGRTYVASSNNSNNSWQVGQWTFISGVDDGSTFKIYVDGAEVTSGGSSPTTTPTLIAKLADDDSGESRWDGYLDEIRFTNTALSADWMSAEYNNQSSPGTFFVLGSSGPGKRKAIMVSEGEKPATCDPLTMCCHGDLVN